MKTYIVIDSEGYFTDQIAVEDGITVEGFDASTWIEIVSSDTTYYGDKRYVDGAWVNLAGTSDKYPSPL